MIVGIDLGTTFSAVASLNRDGRAEIIRNRDGENITPSVVMFDEGSIVVGEAAKENSVSDPENVCQFVKRQIGDKNYTFRTSDGETYTAEEISAMILKRIKEDAEEASGEDITGAVITVPAYFQDFQRLATKDAGEIAGLNVIGIINEPTAAAIAFSYDKKDFSGKVMVFDLGGGTFDITIMDMADDFSNIRTLSTTGNRNLGGYDFDNLIIDWVKKQYEEKFGESMDDDLEAIQDLRLRAENAKKMLSSHAKARINISANGNRLSTELRKEEFDRMMRGHLETMESYMEDALEMAGLEWEDISRILLVGGSSRIPCVQKMIEELTDITPSFELNADEAVALGACYYAENLMSRQSGSKNKTGKTVEIVDVTSHSMGTVARNPENDKREASFVIEANTPIPAAGLGFFQAPDSVNDYVWVNFEVIEGDDIDPAYDTVIFDQRLKETPNSDVVLYMYYDVDGILHAIPYETDEDTAALLAFGYQMHKVKPEEYLSPEKLIQLKQDKLKPLSEQIEIQRKSNLTREQVERKKRSMDGVVID